MLERITSALAAAVVTLHVLLLAHAAWRSSKRSSSSSTYSTAEHKFRSFKRCRIAICSVQLLAQLAAAAVALLADGAQQPGPGPWWGASTEALVLLAHAVTLVRRIDLLCILACRRCRLVPVHACGSCMMFVLCLPPVTQAVLVSTWRWQLSLELRGVLLLALLEPGLLLSADVAAVQEAGGVFAAQRLARLLLHSGQLILLVSLLVGEVIVRGAATCSSSSPAGLAALASGGSNSTGYVPLPSSDLEAGTAKPAQQQRSTSKRHVLW